MGRIRELINKFIQPADIEKTFDELALASGVNQSDLKQLKNYMEGINWKEFARENKEKKAIKKERAQTIDSKEINSKSQKSQSIRKDKREEREFGE